jgi:hypothetical protein
MTYKPGGTNFFTKVKEKELRKVILREPHKATALTDGWLCFKYLDNGEESLSTFADISKGDVITYDRPHPEPERDFVNTPEKPWCYPGCMLVSNAKTEAARKAREEVLEKAIAKIMEHPCTDAGYQIAVKAYLESLRSKGKQPEER